MRMKRHQIEEIRKMDRKGVWSGWYNTDRPWVGNGDVETVSRIESLYGKICRSGYTIVGAQCRDLDVQKTFDSGSEDIGHFLATPCTSQGLECINSQQPVVGDTQMCHDFAVRFRCDYTDNEENTLFPQFDVRIYIILAVFPILIFLVRILWAYVFRRRRQRRRDARRAARQRGERGEDDDDDTSSVASGLANPPPSYHQIFGERGKEGVFVISRDNVPVCNKCETTPCSIAYILKLDANRRQTSSGSAVSSGAASRPAEVHIIRETSSSASLSSPQQQINAQEVSMSTPPHSEQQQQQQQNASDVEQTGITQNELTQAASGNSEAEKWAPASVFPAHRVSIDSVDDIIPHRKVCALASNATVQTYLDTRVDHPHPDSISESGEVSSNPDPQEHDHVSFSFHDETNHSEQNSQNFQEIPLEDVPSTSQAHVSSTTIIASTSSSQSSSTTTANNPGQLTEPPNSPPLFSPLDSTTLDTSCISQPCACVCHRTIPVEGRVVAEYDNAGFVADDGLPMDQATPRLPGMHIQIPLHRVISNASVGSVVTLSELPSYEDALELIKKKEPEQGSE